ncbi:MAG: hypothetical protein RL632_1267, partial [Bacteroidota bacterium]
PVAPKSLMLTQTFPVCDWLVNVIIIAPMNPITVLKICVFILCVCSFVEAKEHHESPVAKESQRHERTLHTPA